MGIDMEKMRARRTALDNRNGSNREVFWRPQDGETTIRIVPTPDGDPFRDYWLHYNLCNNPGFLSPKKNFGEEDALDGFIRKLYKEGTEESKRMAKKLSASPTATAMSFCLVPSAFCNAFAACPRACGKTLSL